VKLEEGMLFVELTKARGGWLWHNDRIDNTPEPITNCLSWFVAESKR
jgi:hypothetical protein